MPTDDWSVAANRRLLLARVSAGLGALIGPLNCDVRALVLLHENQTKMSYGTHMLHRTFDSKTYSGTATKRSITQRFCHFT
jgi:hypothetical protein